MLCHFFEESDQIPKAHRVDKSFESAIDMDQAIIFHTEFILRSLERTNIPYPDRMTQALNNILHSAAKNAESVREMRNLQK